MCELLALSTSEPAQLTFSLKTLAARGSATGGVHDGWGVAFYQGVDVALFREPLAAGDSALVHYLETQGPSTYLGISHIRHAAQGNVSFANTQPFVRELGGRTHTFAHNGTLDQLGTGAVLPLGIHHRCCRGTAYRRNPPPRTRTASRSMRLSTMRCWLPAWR